MFNSKDVGSIQHLGSHFISNFPFEASMSNMKTRGKIGCKLGSEPTPCGHIPMTLTMCSRNTLSFSVYRIQAYGARYAQALKAQRSTPTRWGVCLGFPNRKPCGLLGKGATNSTHTIRIPSRTDIHGEITYSEKGRPPP